MFDDKTPLYALTEGQFAQLVGEILESRIEKHLMKNPNGSDTEDELIAIEDVCNLLQVSKVTIHAWKRDKKIPFHKMGTRLYFKKQEVINSLKSSPVAALTKYVNTDKRKKT